MHTPVMVNITIALPISLAFFDNSFLSGPILSIMVSIAVLINSAIIINNSDEIIIILEVVGISKNAWKMMAIMHSKISWRKDASSWNAARNPSNEYLKA